MTSRSCSGSRSTASWNAVHSSSDSGRPVSLDDLVQPLAGVGAVGVMAGAYPLRSMVAAGQVDQLPANLGRRQVVEVRHVLGTNLGETPMQPDEGRLEQVVGFLPAPDVGITT